MARLIFDTGVLIGIHRRTLQPTTVLEETDDLALPAVVLAEYLTGVDSIQDPGAAAGARVFLDEFRELVPVVPYDERVAAHHAELLTATSRNGAPRGAIDLIIAATAKATGRIVITTDSRARFDELPGVSARVVDDA